MRKERLYPFSGIFLLLCGIADMTWVLFTAYQKLADPILGRQIAKGNMPLFYPLLGGLLVLGLLKLLTGLRAARQRPAAVFAALCIVLSLAGCMLSGATALYSKVLLVLGMLASILAFVCPADRSREQLCIARTGAGIWMIVLAAVSAYFFLREVSANLTFLYGMQRYVMFYEGGLLRITALQLCAFCAQLIGGLAGCIPNRSPRGIPIRSILVVLAALLNTAAVIRSWPRPDLAIWYATSAGAAVVLLLMLCLPTRELPENDTDRFGE